MKAIVYRAYRGPLALEDVEDPACPPDGAVVAVRATGVCRSDWHAWQGHDPVTLPHIPGHEFAGVIAEVGGDVRNWQVGAAVTAPFVCGCGTCEHCRAGDAQVCPRQSQPGFTGPGSFSERVLVQAADTNLIALPEGLNFTTAASLGCRFATAFRALTAHGRLQPGQHLAVHGCGGVGLSAVMIGVALGARVVAVDVVDAALERARALGAQATINAQRVSDPVHVIHQLTAGGAHVSIDALGSPPTAVASVRSLRRRGRHVQVGLLLAAQSTPPIPMDIVVAHELEILGSHGMAAGDYSQMLRLVTDGVLRPDRLVGRVIDLEEAGAALAGMGDAPTTTGMTVVAITQDAG